MTSTRDAAPPSASQAPAEFQHLLPPGGPTSAAGVVESLDFTARAGSGRRRPYVVLNMASTVDGRATLGGRSGSIGNRADRELFHALRASVDAVMAGAGTVRVERYGRIIKQESTRLARRERGLSDEPLACVVSGRLALAPDIPLLAQPAARVVLVTSSQATLPQSAAHVEYVRAARDGRLDLALAMEELGERFEIRTLLCEGGPHLNTQLLLAGLVDELFLSLSPKLAGGEDATGEALRILAGGEFRAPAELDLLSVLESDSYLFLRYGVRASDSAPERVSRETIASSSLAS